MGKPNLTDANEIATALLLWRYVGHRLANGHIVPSDESTSRQKRALRLAKLLGVKDEYLALTFSTPVLTVKFLE